MEAGRYSVMRAIVRLVSVCVILSAAVTTPAQSAKQNPPRERTQFSTGDDPRVDRPVPLPDDVIQILQQDEQVKSCLTDNQLEPGENLSSWFLASQISLASEDERDLVVMPNESRGPTILCFQSVEGIGWFWVFRERNHRYELALKAAGLGLRVLKSKHKGHRDVETGATIARYVTTYTYCFDGTRYAEFKRTVSEVR